MKQLIFITCLSLNLFSAGYIYSPSEPTGNELIIPSPANKNFNSEKKSLSEDGIKLAYTETKNINDTNEEDKIPLGVKEQVMTLNDNDTNEEDSGDKDFNKIPLGVKEQVISDNENDEEDSGDKDFNKIPLGVKEQVMN